MYLLFSTSAPLSNWTRPDRPERRRIFERFTDFTRHTGRKKYEGKRSSGGRILLYSLYRENCACAGSLVYLHYLKDYLIYFVYGYRVYLKVPCYLGAFCLVDWI